MNEIWKDIPNYEGLYQASNLGRIRSLDREIKHNYGGIAIRKGKIKQPHIRICFGKERWQATLCKEGKVSYPVWARCIYSAFYGEIPEGYQINHIDENPANNRLDNLNLMTPKENSNWGTRIERVAKANSITKQGTNTYNDNPNSTYIIEYDKLGKEVCIWFSVKAAAEYHNKHYTTLWLILSGKTKSLRNGTFFRYYKREG